MPYNPQLSIQGIQEVQARNAKRIATMQTGGAAEDAVRDAIASLHRYAVSITHVGQYPGGGALRASHRMEVEGLEGMVYIDPGSTSPRRSGRRKYKPAEYGVYEHARGGEHAFYDRTVESEGPQVIARTQARIREAILYAE